MVAQIPESSNERSEALIPDRDVLLVMKIKEKTEAAHEQTTSWQEEERPIMVMSRMRSAMNVYVVTMSRAEPSGSRKS